MGPRLPATSAQEEIDYAVPDCPVPDLFDCCALLGENIQTRDLYRCPAYASKTLFSDIASMPAQEEYGAEYFDDTHRRWFEHPNTVLFDLVCGDSFQREGRCWMWGAGAAICFAILQGTRPDIRLTGIDFAPNRDDFIHFLQGDVVTLEIEEAVRRRGFSLSVIEHVPDCVALYAPHGRIDKAGRDDDP